MELKIILKNPQKYANMEKYIKKKIIIFKRYINKQTSKFCYKID